MYNDKRIKAVKERVLELIKKEFINEHDIKMLSNITFDEVISLWESDMFRKKVLFTIYLNPYLLCNDEIVKYKPFDIDIISNILIKRYNEELDEYKNRLLNGEISNNEYLNNCNCLTKLYFTSTLMGIRIINNYNDRISNPKNIEKIKKI